MKTIQNAILLTFVLFSITTISCSRRAAPSAPKMDPSALSARALELYDTDKNGKIDGKELDATPALAFSLRELDANRDKGLDADEIRTRLEAWNASGVTLMSPNFSCKVAGKTVKEGTLKLTPDPFMGSAFPSAQGEFLNGACQPAAPNPGNYQAIPLGFYSVEVSSPQGNIPPGKLGVEVFEGSQYFQKNGEYRLSF